MSLPAKLLALAVIVATSAAALIALLRAEDPLIVIALIVMGLLAVGTVGLIVFLDLVVQAARQVFGRPTDSPSSADDQP